MRDPFTKVSDILRTQIRDGLASPATLLVVTDIARTLQISPTPVREALCQLAGEGLIEVQKGRGARVRPLDAKDLSDLYRLHALYAAVPQEPQSASQAAPALPKLVPRPAADVRRDRAATRERTEALFRDLVAFDGGVMQQALAFVTDRLAIVRLAEGEVFDDLSQEVSELQDLTLAHDLSALRGAIRGYHRRRLGAVAALTSAVRDIFRQ